MDGARKRARFDGAVELCGAIAPGLAAGFAGLKLAPSLGVAASAAMTVSAVGGFGLGWLVMRMIPPAERVHALAQFAVAPIEPEEEPLLLETIYEEPMVGAMPGKPAADEALLLDDPLIDAESGSRVVQLFASQPMPTPGQLRERIDRHLADGRPEPRQFPPPPADATGALHAALDELRRSLR